MLRLALTLCAAITWQAPGAQAQGADADIEVQVRREGRRVIVDAKCQVHATVAEVWEVINDYEGATRFISNLIESKVLARSSERLLVAQKGTIGFGPFTVEVESVREVRLYPPRRTESRGIRGNAGHARTTTELIARGERVEIVHHAESEPEFWLPPLIGPALIERDTRARFQELREEILRRSRAAGK